MLWNTNQSILVKMKTKNAREKECGVLASSIEVSGESMTIS